MIFHSLMKHIVINLYFVEDQIVRLHQLLQNHLLIRCSTLIILRLIFMTKAQLYLHRINHLRIQKANFMRMIEEIGHINEKKLGVILLKQNIILSRTSCHLHETNDKAYSNYHSKQLNFLKGEQKKCDIYSFQIEESTIASTMSPYNDASWVCLCQPTRASPCGHACSFFLHRKWRRT